MPSFEWLYDEYFALAWRTLRRLGVPEEGLDDAVQDVFLVVYRRLGKFRGESSEKTWLFGIVRRVAADHRRRKSRKGQSGPLQTEVPDPSAGPAEQAARNEAALILQRLLDQLDDDKRAVFVLAELEGMPAPAIAEALEVKVNTVYSRLRAARAHINAAVARLEARRVS